MIYFLIPTFNEKDNIPNLAKEIISSLPMEEKFFIFSDDGSSDNTIEIINQFFEKEQFIVIGGDSNNGPGYAFNKGFEWILENSLSDNDIIITLEADCTSDIQILPTMLALSKMGFDLVLASVYAQGGGFDKTSFFRKFLSSIANLFLRYIYDIKVLTLSSFYRIYSISIIRKIKSTNPKIINEPGFISMLEILIKSIKQNAKIIEVPMKLHSTKRQGKSKMKIIKTTFAYLNFLLKRK